MKQNNNKSTYVKLTQEQWDKRRKNRLQNKINDKMLAETLAFQVAIRDFQGEWKVMDENPEYIILDDSRIWSIKRKIFRKTFKQSVGYTFSGSFIVNGKKQLCLTHRLVAKNFIPNEENKPEVQHINGIKTDNRVTNLLWVTHAENMSYAKNDGIMARGETSGTNKLTEANVREIRASKDTMKSLAEKFNVSFNCISNIKSRKTWNHVQ